VNWQQPQETLKGVSHGHWWLHYIP
jgi:hypothetical protein